RGTGMRGWATALSPGSVPVEPLAAAPGIPGTSLSKSAPPVGWLPPSIVYAIVVEGVTLNVSEPFPPTARTAAMDEYETEKVWGSGAAGLSRLGATREMTRPRPPA